MDLLDWVLDDLVVTVEELQQLDELTADLQLTELEILRAHEQYFKAMVNGANKDGIITKEERHTLLFIARALEIPTERVPAISSPKVGDEAIRAGAAICFTGTFVDGNGEFQSLSWRLWRQTTVSVLFPTSRSQSVTW